jgi:hypothetical protein
VPLEIKKPLTNAPELQSLSDLCGEWRICANMTSDQMWVPTCSWDDYKFIRDRLWSGRYSVPPLSAVRGIIRDEFGQHLALYVRVHPHFRGAENWR